MNLQSALCEVRSRLTETGTSVAALCREAGVARSTWDRWERHETQPNLATWLLVQGALERLTAPAPKGDLPTPTSKKDAA